MYGKLYYSFTKLEEEIESTHLDSPLYESSEKKLYQNILNDEDLNGNYFVEKLRNGVSLEGAVEELLAEKKHSLAYNKKKRNEYNSKIEELRELVNVPYGLEAPSFFSIFNYEGMAIGSAVIGGGLAAFVVQSSENINPSPEKYFVLGGATLLGFLFGSFLHFSGHPTKKNIFEDRHGYKRSMKEELQYIDSKLGLKKEAA